MKKNIIILLSFLLISTPVMARTLIEEENVQQAQKIKHKRYFWTKQLDDLNIVGKVKHIPENINKVIVPYFRVTFALGGKYLNSVGGVTTSKTKVYSQLNGIDESLLQEITDQMYEDLLLQLKNNGYEVMDLSILEQNETYQKLQESSNYPILKKTSAMFTPQNRYYPATIAVKAYMLANEVDALMLKADYTVNFISMARNEKKFNLLKDKSDVTVGQGINVFGEISVLTEKGLVTFQIQQPITSDKPFGEVVDATTAMNKVTDGVAFVGSILNGKLGDRHSTSTVEVNADSALYKEAVTDALTKSNGTLASYMSATIEGEELSNEDIQEE
ncbi:MAG: hypothetical protein KC713_06960 [Candidatus Omnitrophica bacterium]|nr:hypothetical protein [Candidatus Omnitrophota bacterium]